MREQLLIDCPAIGSKTHQRQIIDRCDHRCTPPRALVSSRLTRAAHSSFSGYTLSQKTALLVEQI